MMRRSNRARYKLEIINKLASNAVLRRLASQESPFRKGFFKKLFIGIKPV
jgi:hypothetical protein